MALSNDDNGDKTREVLAAQAHIWSHTFSFIKSMSLKCAIQLGIPDIIHSHGRPMTLSDLVNALSINYNKAKHQDCISRLMLLFRKRGLFTHSKFASPHKNEPLSLVPFVQMELNPNLTDPWHSLSEWFKNDGDDDSNNSTPYATAHRKPLYEYARNEPRFNHVFNEAVAEVMPGLVMSVLIKNGKGVFEGLKSLVDVGGGTGTVAKAIVDAFPQINCTVLDLPHVVEGLEGCENLSFVGGDMFKSIPSADAILIKVTL
ncbi:hypothetical protein HAX54_042744 [Datura stramonium]|uniref:Trans-resveratrol di-O-methyltransferase n=1 Tax=Datura stramonium TaxID=4076 RepID=A0ABS8SNJ7_DATST|nr:hypothetical protein [Datura stramonium]